MNEVVAGSPDTRMRNSSRTGTDRYPQSDGRP